MTLKYESELLFNLMKRDGDDAPSDVLPYESELKEKYLNQVVGAYPKLQDYRPEWLYYNLYHHLPSDFPVESVANVTSASFNNVVPYAYKSAILNGQTLVNLTSNDKIYYQKAPTDNWNDYPIAINPQRCSINIKNIKPNTTYLIKTLSETKEFYIRFFNETTTTSNGNTGWISINSTFTTLSDTNKISISFRLSKENEDYTDVSQCSNILLLEYQDGMENWDIDYFEGMQSVKVPVLTTSNEDGTKSNILTVNDDVTLRGIGEVQDTLDCLTGELTQRIGEMVLDGSDDEVWLLNPANAGTNTAVFYISKFFNQNTAMIMDKFIPSTHTNFWSGEENDTENYLNNSQSIAIRILKSKLISIDVSAFKSWLSQNPITVQYQLTTESIKTVDLSCINEQGESETFRPIEGTMHVSTSSQTLPPLLDMSVPVEATTQNLMSFANIEEEE